MCVRGKDANGDYHRIDDGGNHFINGECVNPLSPRLNPNVDPNEVGDIGDTYHLFNQ